MSQITDGKACIIFQSETEESNIVVNLYNCHTCADVYIHGADELEPLPSGVYMLVLCMFVCLLIQSYLTLCKPMDCWTPLSMEFSKQEYWSGLPFPSPGDLPDPGMELESLVSPSLASRFFTSTTWEALACVTGVHHTHTVCILN